MYAHFCLLSIWFEKKIWKSVPQVQCGPRVPKVLLSTAALEKTAGTCWAFLKLVERFWAALSSTQQPSSQKRLAALSSSLRSAQQLSKILSSAYTQYLLIRNGVNFRLVRFLFFPDFYTIFVSYFSHFIQSPFLKNLSKNGNMLKNCNIWWNFE